MIITLTAPDLTHPEHRPLTATLTYSGTDYSAPTTVALAGADDAFTVPAHLAASIARRMLTQLTGNPHITAEPQTRRTFRPCDCGAENTGRQTHSGGCAARQVLVVDNQTGEVVVTATEITDAPGRGLAQ